MKKIIKTFGILLGIIVLFVCATYILLPNLWAYYFPFLREPSSWDTAAEFAMALRENEQKAYELADPQLWPKIDEWMETHRVRECVRNPGEQLTGGFGSAGDHTVFFYCFTDTGRYEFEIRDIYITEEQPYRVIDWGVVKEGPSR